MAEVKWAVIELNIGEQGFLESFIHVDEVESIKEAERLRVLLIQDMEAGGYIMNPQNIQVLQYAS